MLDLDDQVREYVKYLDRQTPRTSVGAVLERGSSGSPSIGLRRHAFVLGAAALLVVVIGAVVLIGPFGGEQVPPIDEGTSTTAASSTSTSTATTASTTAPTSTVATSTTAPVPPVGLSMSWSRVDGLGAPGEQWISDIVVGGPGLVAVGADGALEDSNAAVWHSTDGQSWIRVPHDDEIFGGPGSQHIAAVAVGDLGLVAVGSEWLGDVDAAAVWTSPDGITWSRVPHDEAVFGGEGYPAMWDVIPWQQGLLAVGRRSSGDDPVVAGVWTSSDGLVWERVPHDEDAFESSEDLGVSAVVQFGSGLVAVGAEGPGVGSGGDGQPAVVWVSSDGFTWERVSGRDPAFQSVHLGQGERRVGVEGDWATMSAVTVGGPGLVAVGEDGWCTASGGCRTEAAVWVSTDGRLWQRQTRVDQVGRFTRMHSVTTFADGLVAVGSSDSEGDFSGPVVVWTSTDGGNTWVRQPHDAAVFGSSGLNRMLTATQLGSDLIVGGLRGSDAAVWIGTRQD